MNKRRPKKLLYFYLDAKKTEKEKALLQLVKLLKRKAIEKIRTDTTGNYTPPEHTLKELDRLIGIINKKPATAM